MHTKSKRNDIKFLSASGIPCSVYEVGSPWKIYVTFKRRSCFNCSKYLSLQLVVGPQHECQSDRPIIIAYTKYMAAGVGGGGHFDNPFSISSPFSFCSHSDSPTRAMHFQTSIRRKKKNHSTAIGQKLPSPPQPHSIIYLILEPP